MADRVEIVGGSLDGSILENAATEATLQELVAAIAVLSQKVGADKKTQTHNTKQIKDFYLSVKLAKDQIGKLNEGYDEQAKQVKENNKELGNNTKSLREYHRGLNTLSSAISTTVTKLTGMAGTLAGMGNTFSGAAAAFGQIPIVGDMLSQVFGGIAQSADRLYGSFRESASVGANFNGSIRGMIDAVSGTGLTFEEFSGIVSKNGESLAYLGGTTVEGAKRLASMAKMVRGSTLGDDLARLGFSTQDVSNYMAHYTGVLQRTTGIQGMTTAQLASASVNYMKNLDLLSKLTGKSRDILQSEQDTRLRDIRYRRITSRMDAVSRTNFDNMLSLMGDEMGAAYLDIAATGTATTKEAENLVALMPDLANRAFSDFAAIRRTGAYSVQRTAETYDVARNSSEEFRQTMGDTSMYLRGELNNLAVEAEEVAKRQIGYNQALAQFQQDEAEARNRLNDTLDPAKMMQFQQQIAETSNRFTVLMAEQLPKLTDAFDKLADIMKQYAVPAYQKLIDNMWMVVGVYGSLKVAMMLFEIALKRQAANAAGGNLLGQIPGMGSVGKILKSPLGRGGLGIGMMLYPSELGNGELTEADRLELKLQNEKLKEDKKHLSDQKKVNNELLDANKQEIEIRKQQVDNLRPYNNPIQLLLDEIKRQSPQVYQGFLEGRAVELGMPGRLGRVGPAKDFLKQKEGMQTQAYPDAGGYSIGYGHLITPEEYTRGYMMIGDERVPVAKNIRETKITPEQAEKLFEQDLKKVAARAERQIGQDAWSKLNDNQRSAIASYVYNTGSAKGLVQRGLREAIMAGDWGRAAELIRTGISTSQGKYVQGLANRRAEEAELFMTPGTSAPSSELASPWKSNGTQTPSNTSLIPEKTKNETENTSVDKNTGAKSSGPVADMIVQKSPSELLAELNNKLDTLIGINKAANDINNAQLRAFKSQTNNLFAGV